MEVVGEDAPGEYLDAAEQGVFLEEGAELFPLACLEGEALFDEP
jgi:hypothetical protein